jgi:hypothetical protein
MKLHYLKKILCAAAVLTSCLTGATAYAATDGEMKLSATTLNVNDELTITLSTKVYCKINMKVMHLDSHTDVYSGPLEFKIFNPPVQYKVKLTKPGKYRVWAIKAEQNTCGNMTLADQQKDIEVRAPMSTLAMSPAVANAIVVGAPASGQCPDGYTKDASTSSEDVKKGALRCVKNAVSCPQGWVGTMEPSTGALTCTVANPPTCPAGWHGNAQTGKLVCNPVTPAKLNCPANTPDWQWGTKYYSENWNVVGCNPNLKPAY